MKFVMGRASFSRTKQKTIIPSEFDGDKMKLVEELLQTNSEYHPPHGRGYTSIYLGNFIQDEDGRLLAARLGKRKMTTLSKYQEKEYSRVPTENFPNIVMLWDAKEQIVLLERNTSVFVKNEIVFNSLEDHINDLLVKYEMSVQIEPITETVMFWNVLEKYDNVYSVSFKLHMPNFIGDANKGVRDFLKTIDKKFKASSYEEILISEAGELAISKEDSDVEETLKWIAEGGGTWEIRANNSQEKRKTRISNRAEKIMKVLEYMEEAINFDRHFVKGVVHVLRKQYRLLKEIRGDEK